MPDSPSRSELLRGQLERLHEEGRRVLKAASDAIKRLYNIQAEIDQIEAELAANEADASGPKDPN